MLPGPAYYALSPEAAVLIAPWRAWPLVSKTASRYWLSRPLFALFVYGCAASLAGSGRVSLRFTVAAMVNAVYVPLLQIGALRVLYRGAIPFRRAVDLFYTGHAAMSLTVLVFGATWAFMPPASAGPRTRPWSIAALILFAWSWYVDYWFFRSVAGRGAGAAVAHRFMWCLPALAIFVGPGAWQELLNAVRL